MTTNEKIAKWLGLKEEKKQICWDDGTVGDVIIPFDFLHDRNQQKWIEDKLIELGYGIMYDYIPEEKQHGFSFYMKVIKASADNQSKDLAFINAVEQLIDKEDESNI